MDVAGDTGLRVNWVQRRRRGEVERGREKWGTTVTAAGVGMLGLGGMCLIGRVCVTMGSERRLRFAGEVSFFLLSIVTSLLGILAGTKRTVWSVSLYLRVLLLFVGVSVAASVGGSIVMEKNWVHRHDSHYPYQPSLPLVVLQGVVNDIKNDGRLFGLLGSSQDKDDGIPLPTIDETPSNPSATDKDDSSPQSDRDEKRHKTVTVATDGKVSIGSSDNNSSLTHKADTDEKPTDADDRKPDRDDTDEKLPSTDKDDKDDRSELPYWTRQDVEDGMLLAAFVLTLIVLGTGSCYLYCACSLLELAKEHEEMTIRDNHSTVRVVIFPEVR